MRAFIEYRVYFFIIIAITGIAVLVNACKKDSSDNVAYFLTYGKWTLASVTRQHFVGDTLKSTDTLNTQCDSPQVFKFNTDNSCTYSNYHCIPQKRTAMWQLINNDLQLQTTLNALDTVGGLVTKKDTATAFKSALVINLGQYSLVLQTGDISTYYTSKTKRVITRYGFVHVTN